MSIKTSPIISAHHLSFQYDQQLVLDQVSFDIHPGEFVGIIGPNGSGKTTLLKIMLGLLPAQTGSLTVLNQGVTFGHPPQKIAYVPQKVTQAEKRFPITVQEVVALGMVRGQRLFQWLTPTDQQLINESLATVGLADKKHQQLTSLSGGQQQRVFIAKALAANPQLLILDEPTVGIDQQSQRQFYNLLSHLNREHHLTIILVSHDIDVIVNEVSTVLCLNKNLIYHGNPQKFIKADYLEKLYGENRRYVIHGH